MHWVLRVKVSEHVITSLSEQVRSRSIYRWSGDEELLAVGLFRKSGLPWTQVKCYGNIHREFLMMIKYKTVFILSFLPLSGLRTRWRRCCWARWCAGCSYTVSRARWWSPGTSSWPRRKTTPGSQWARGTDSAVSHVSHSTVKDTVKRSVFQDIRRNAVSIVIGHDHWTRTIPNAFSALKV